jgi:hypothetical protein
VKKHLLLIVASIIVYCNLQAQKHTQFTNDLRLNYYDAIKLSMKHYDTIDVSIKGSGYKPFLRWKNNNLSRYWPDGNRQLVSPFFAAEQYQQFLQNSGKKTRGIHANWKELGPSTISNITGHYAPGLGRLEDIWAFASNPNRMYFGTRSGGFWRTNDGGLNWQNTTDTLFASGVNAIAVSPTNVDSVLINVRNADNGNSHGIYRSTNGGLTWVATNFKPSVTGFGGLGNYFQVHQIHYHPLVANKIFMATSDGIFVSNDNLTTWNQILAGSNITAIAFHPTNSNYVYAYDDSWGGTNANNILVSSNAGTSFAVGGSLAGNNGETIFLSTSAACPNSVFAASGSGIYKSTNRGTSFSSVSAPPATVRAIAVHTADSNKMVAGYVDLYNSTNGGVSLPKCTWWSLGSTQHGSGNLAANFVSTDVYVHADCNILKCINGVYYAGTDGFFCKSTDNGATWQILNNNKVGVREYYNLGAAQNNHWTTYVGSQDNGESIYNKNGWTEFYGADGMEGIVHPLNEKIIMGSGQYGFKRRTWDGGQTQTGVSPDVDDGAWITPFAYDPLNPFRVYDFTDSVMVTNDFGGTWNFLHKPTLSGNTTNAAIAENNSKIILMANNAVIKRSLDGGSTFATISTGLPSNYITDMAFDPKDDNTIAVTYDRYQADGKKIYITNNGGTTWKNITYNLGSMPLQSVVIDHTPQRNIYVGAEIGVYVKAMADTVWQLYNSGLPNVTVKELEVCYGSNTLKAATWGRGLWEVPLKNRKDYPAIVTTNLDVPVNLELPRENSPQHVTSKISYNGSINSAWVKWGLDTINLTNTIAMTNTVDSTWRTVSPIPGAASNSRIFFRVYALGNNGDTSETYRFTYLARPSILCEAYGTDDGSGLSITNVTVANIVKGSGNNSYTLYPDVANLNANTVYTITVTGSTSWSNNDYGAWIDYNGDNYFDENSERILYAIDAGSSATNTFTLPAVYNGVDKVILRVRMSYWDDSPSPCGSTLGEVEDYYVQMNFPAATSNLTNSNFSIYPNPTKDVLVIDAKNIDRSAISIVNSVGVQMPIEIKSNSAEKCTLSTTAYAKGIYLLQYKNSVRKFAVE